MLGDYRVQSGAHEQIDQQVDDLAGAAAHEQLIGAHSVAGGDLVPEQVAAAVGIAIQFTKRRLDRLDRARRGADRILVGGELYRLSDPEFALDFFDGLAGLVRGERGNSGQDEIFNLYQCSIKVGFNPRPASLQDTIRILSKKGSCAQAPSTRA